MPTFQILIRLLLISTQQEQNKFAKRLGISTSYLCDLINGRRSPNPALVNKICDCMLIESDDRKQWHAAGARAVGWEV